jgi:hypothetical protein
MEVKFQEISLTLTSLPPSIQHSFWPIKEQYNPINSIVPMDHNGLSHNWTYYNPQISWPILPTLSEYLCYFVHLYVPYFPYVPVTTWAFAKPIQSLFGIIPKFSPHPKKRKNFFAFNAKL